MLLESTRRLAWGWGVGAEESGTHNNCVMTQAVDLEGRSVWLEVSTQEAPLRNKKGYLHVQYTLSSSKTAEARDRTGAGTSSAFM